MSSAAPTGFRTFLGAKKNPPKRVFPKTIIDSLSAAILAWSIILDPEVLPVLQLMGVDYVVDPIDNSRNSYHRV